MSEIKNMKVEFINDEHIFVDNKQFVSLKYLAESRANAEQCHSNEIKVLSNKIQELTKENEALKTLLKKKLDGVVDDHSAKTPTNKVCKSEEDHEWEWTSSYIASNHFICKKCGAHRTYPYDYSITTTTSGI